MTTVLTDNANYTAIANAIRSKLGVQTTYMPSEMADAITAIPTSGGSDLGTKTITANGTYNASNDNLDGYSQVTVNVPSSGGGRLPSGYTEVEYIEFSGAQFIHITKTIIKNMLVHGRARPSASGEIGILGCNMGNNWELYTQSPNKYVQGWNYVSNLIEIELDQDTFPYIGRFHNNTYDSEFAIGCYYKPNTSPQRYLFVGYIYEITFVQWNGTTNRWEDFLHFIPCTRDSDDEPGFYETVDGVFYTNDGSGSLIAGPTL